MLKEAGQLCKATDGLPLYVLEGGQGSNSSKFAAAHLQELYRQEGRKTNSEAFHTPATQPDQWPKALTPFTH